MPDTISDAAGETSKINNTGLTPLRSNRWRDQKTIVKVPRGMGETYSNTLPSPT
jgi:hypothetical protein